MEIFEMSEDPVTRGVRVTGTGADLREIFIRAGYLELVSDIDPADDKAEIRLDREFMASADVEKLYNSINVYRKLHP